MVTLGVYGRPWIKKSPFPLPKFLWWSDLTQQKVGGLETGRGKTSKNISCFWCKPIPIPVNNDFPNRKTNSHVWLYSSQVPQGLHSIWIDTSFSDSSCSWLRPTGGVGQTSHVLRILKPRLKGWSSYTRRFLVFRVFWTILDSYSSAVWNVWSSLVRDK